MALPSLQFSQVSADPHGFRDLHSGHCSPALYGDGDGGKVLPFSGDGGGDGRQELPSGDGRGLLHGGFCPGLWGCGFSWTQVQTFVLVTCSRIQNCV